MKKFKFLSFAVAAMLCVGFVSCGDDEGDEPQNPATENTGGASGSADDNSGTGGSGDSSNTPANPETDEYGIAVSQEVDLGLSVNWASWNVGASSPEEYGGYYAWGETEEKSNYNWSTYKWCNGNKYSLTKYCTSSRYGTVDNKTDLEPQDDVANKKWGNGWRMPTKEEFKELESNCTWEWISYKGVNGCKVTGKELANGKRNCIFLPAAGYREGSLLDDAGEDGSYWSSTLSMLGDDYNSGPYGFAAGYIDYLGCLNVNLFNGSGSDIRYLGHSVRPVKNK